MALERLRGFESKSFLLASGDFRSSSNGNVHDLTATYRTQVIKLEEGIRRKWLSLVYVIVDRNAPAIISPFGFH